MKRAALFFDIDGTLLSEVTHQIPESAVHALEEAKKKGHLIFVNTGRTICSIPEELKRLPVHGFLCGCGIYGEFEEEIFFEKHLDGKAADAIVKKAQECRVDALYEGKDDVYFSSRISRFDSLENTRKYMNNRGLGLERCIEQGGCAYDKLFAYEDEHSNSREFFDFLSDYLEILDRGNHTYECIMKGYSKATIMEVVLKNSESAGKIPMHSETAAMIWLCSGTQDMELPWAFMIRFLIPMQNTLRLQWKRRLSGSQ